MKIIISGALGILKPYDKTKSGLFKSKDEVDSDAYKNAKKNREEILKYVYKAVNTNKKISEDTAAIARLKGQISSYESVRWQGYHRKCPGICKENNFNVRSERPC